MSLPDSGHANGHARGNVQEVIHALETAAWQNRPSAEQVTAANNQLNEWQTQPGYHMTLQDIGQSQSFPTALRLLALTQLKNGIDKHWRAGSAISPNEQDHIRSNLQRIEFDENDSRVISLVSVVFSSIARRDFPNKWPSLFEDLSTLYSAVAEASQNQFTFVLKIIQKTITEFQTLRLAVARNSYYDKAPRLLSALAGDRRLHEVLTTQQMPQVNLQASLINVALLLKCLRRLAVGAFENPHTDSNVIELWKMSLHWLSAAMGSGISHSHWSIVVLRQIIKLHVTMAQQQAVSFGLLEPLDLIHFYWNKATAFRKQQFQAEAESQTDVERGIAQYFILRALLLLRACFKIAHNPVTTGRIVRGRDPEEPAKARNFIRANVFDDGFITKIFQDLLSSHLLYSKDDIEQWIDEAEDWEIRESEAEDAFEHSARPCAERLFMDIALWRKDLIVQPLLALVEQDARPGDAFVTDAIFSALGICAARINEDFNFNDFFETQISANMQLTGENTKIIRRRIAILLAQWTPITNAVSAENRKRIYGLFVDLLDPNDERNDEVVRITAGKRFKDIGDDFQFDSDGFKPYASSIMRHVVDLIAAVDLTENKIALLGTLTCIVERMDKDVLEFANELTTVATKLWEAFDEEQMVKKAIVNIFTKLAGSLRGASSPLQPIVIPLLRRVLDPTSAENLYLFEDSLELLHELVKQCAYPADPDLIRITLEYMHLLDRPDAEYIQVLLDILESLVLLAHREILLEPNARHLLLQQLSPLMIVQNMQVVSNTTACLDHLIQAANFQGEEVDAPMTVVRELGQTGFFKASTDCVLSCWAAHQTHGPNRKDPPRSARSETYFLNVWARILFSSPSAFAVMIQSAASERGADVLSIMKRIIDEWFSHLDNIGDLKKTKLMVLALTRLLETPEPWIMTSLQQYMTTWTSLIVELRDSEDDKVGDALVLNPENATSHAFDSPEIERKDWFSKNDPVFTIYLRQYVKDRVDILVTQSGGLQQFREQVLVDVDADVVAQFMDLF